MVDHFISGVRKISLLEGRGPLGGPAGEMSASSRLLECVAQECCEAVFPCMNFPYGSAANSARTTPKWTIRSQLMAAVSRRASRSSPVKLASSSNTMKLSPKSRGLRSSRAGSRFRFSQNRPAGPASNPSPPSVPRTTGALKYGYGARQSSTK